MMLCCPICEETRLARDPKTGKAIYTGRCYEEAICKPCAVKKKLQDIREVKKQLPDLTSIFHKLEPDARLILVEFANRLLRGQAKYGKLNIDTDDRDWEREAFEEDLDGAMYRIAGFIERRRNRKEE